MAWDVQAEEGSSAVGRELLERAGNLKLLIDNLQTDAKMVKTSMNIIKEEAKRRALNHWRQAVKRKEKRRPFHIRLVSQPPRFYTPPLMSVSSSYIRLIKHGECGKETRLGKWVTHVPRWHARAHEAPCEGSLWWLATVWAGPTYRSEKEHHAAERKSTGIAEVTWKER